MGFALKRGANRASFRGQTQQSSILPPVLIISLAQTVPIISAMPTAQELIDEASGSVAMGELAEAARLYRQATEAEPDNFDAWHSLGMALMRDGQHQAALGPALMATDLRPNDLLAWTALSQLHVKMGQIAEAETAKANARILSLGGRIAQG